MVTSAGVENYTLLNVDVDVDARKLTQYCYIMDNNQFNKDVRVG